MTGSRVLSKLSPNFLWKWLQKWCNITIPAPQSQSLNSLVAPHHLWENPKVPALGDKVFDAVASALSPVSSLVTLATSFLPQHPRPHHWQFPEHPGYFKSLFSHVIPLWGMPLLPWTIWQVPTDTKNPSSLLLFEVSFMTHASEPCSICLHVEGYHGQFGG